MGMLFGGWAKEEDEEWESVKHLYKSRNHWKYEKEQESQRLSSISIVREYSNSEPKVTVGDIIIPIGHGSQKEKEFLVKEIINGEIYGFEIPSFNSIEKYDKGPYLVMKSITSNFKI